MATPEDIATLRGYINEPVNAEPFTDAELGAIIDASPSLEAAAAQIWRQKASRYADMVDVQEGSSRRSLGDLYEQAIDMSKVWDTAAGTDTSTVRRPARTRPIERP